jgi:hypothetical protein
MIVFSFVLLARDCTSSCPLIRARLPSTHSRLFAGFLKGTVVFARETTAAFLRRIDGPEVRIELRLH